MQNAIQHFAVGLGGILSSFLIYFRPDLSLDFTNLIFAALIMAIFTPMLWIRYRKNSIKPLYQLLNTLLGKFLDFIWLSC